MNGHDLRELTGPAELALAIECCRHSFRDRADSLASPPAGIDWSVFLRIVRFHRIEGFAWSCLAPQRSTIPAEFSNELQSAASEIAAKNLRAAQECRTLRDAFKAAEIPLLFLKGLSLGALSYGNPAPKSSIDIDLLIDPEDLVTAATILRECGFRLVAPTESFDHQILRRWHHGWKESVWRNDGTRTQIDLHTRPADNPRLIPTITVRSARQNVEIGGRMSLPTLADEELFAYLTVHGASSAWFRLKWIADLGGFLSGRDTSAIDQLYQRSQALGAGRAAGQALLLADALFGTLEDNSGLRRRLNRDPATVRLFRAALNLITQKPVEPTEKRWGTFPIHSTQLLLLPGFGYKMSEVSRQARRLFNRPAA